MKKSCSQSNLGAPRMPSRTYFPKKVMAPLKTMAAVAAIAFPLSLNTSAQTQPGFSRGNLPVHPTPPQPAPMPDSTRASGSKLSLLTFAQWENFRAATKNGSDITNLQTIGAKLLIPLSSDTRHNLQIGLGGSSSSSSNTFRFGEFTATKPSMGGAFDIVYKYDNDTTLNLEVGASAKVLPAIEGQRMANATFNAAVTVPLTMRTDGPTASITISPFFGEAAEGRKLDAEAKVGWKHMVFSYPDGMSGEVVIAAGYMLRRSPMGVGLMPADISAGNTIETPFGYAGFSISNNEIYTITASGYSNAMFVVTRQIGGQVVGAKLNIASGWFDVFGAYDVSLSPYYKEARYGGRDSDPVKTVSVGVGLKLN